MEKSLVFLLVILISNVCYGEIRLLTFDIPPLVYVQNQDLTVNRTHFSGYSVQFIEQAFSHTDIDYTMREKPLKRALYDARTKPNTCTFPVDRTQERESKYEWVGPVAINRYALYSAENTSVPLVTLSDAKPYSLAVYAGTGIADYLTQGSFNLYETKSLEQGLQMLNSNRVDLWVADTNAADLLTNTLNMPSLEPELVFFTTIRYMACNLNTEEDNLAALNEFIRKMYQSGEAQNILRIEQ
jgi:polar amino acid transport system substrate-binding protein